MKMRVREKLLVMGNFFFFPQCFYTINELSPIFTTSEIVFYKLHNPLPHMPMFGSSDSAANKNMMSKIWTNGVQLSD